MAASIDQDWIGMLQATDFTQSLAEREEAHAREIRSILLAFLEVLDGLDRLVSAPDVGAARSLAILQRQMLAAFVAADVTFVDGVGMSFDPEVHLVVDTRPAGGEEVGIVVEEIRRGCWRRNTLLRPAEVVVSQ